MKKVSKNKFLKRFTVVSTVCSIFAAVINAITGNTWIAVMFVISAVSSTIFYASQTDEDND